MGLVFYSLKAQNLPQGISYQAVAIKKEKVNLGGENLSYIYWSKKDIVVRFSIYDTYPGGNVEYSETHNTKTDDYGVFNLIIGKGDKVSGIFEEINWELGDAHLKVEIDFDGFGKFELIGIEKFWSVPYAFVSKKQGVNNSGNDSLFLDLYGKYNYLRDRDKDTVIGNEGGVSYEYLDSINRVLFDSLRKLQFLISRDQDTVIGNEWQDLVKSNDSLLISMGKGVKLNDDDSTNELQNIYLKGDTLYLSNSKEYVLLDSIYSRFNRLSNPQKNDSFIGNSSFFADLEISELSLGSKVSNPIPIHNVLEHVHRDTLFMLATMFDKTLNYKDYYVLGVFKKAVKDSTLTLLYKTDILAGTYYLKYSGTDLKEQFIGEYYHGYADSSKFVILSNKDGVIHVDFRKKNTTSTKLNFPTSTTLPELNKYWSIGSRIHLHQIKDTTMIFVFHNSSGQSQYILKYDNKKDNLFYVDSLSNSGEKINLLYLSTGCIGQYVIGASNDKGSSIIRLNLSTLKMEYFQPANQTNTINMWGFVLSKDIIMLIPSNNNGGAIYWDLVNSKQIYSPMYQFLKYPIPIYYGYLSGQDWVEYKPIYKNFEVEYFVKTERVNIFDYGTDYRTKLFGALYKTKFSKP